MGPTSEEVLVGVGIHGESNPGDGGVGKSRCDEDGGVDGVHGCGSFGSCLQLKRSWLLWKSICQHFGGKPDVARCYR
ncbi:hypothetical protein B9Z55_017021 [Caenorhabditis nigoni]|uniref:Uncharacterized protein n=1 Tax=Caenorhabditis nigoni TaxID=1611254 RepID=A0A2G5T7P1_9PELO|nr:hypothetical protein B9Z55_017021 [Caenorhabditis nigoni]